MKPCPNEFRVPPRTSAHTVAQSSPETFVKYTGTSTQTTVGQCRARDCAVLRPMWDASIILLLSRLRRKGQEDEEPEVVDGSRKAAFS